MTEAPQAALGAARTLALTRVVAGLVILTSADVHSAARFAGLPRQLVTPPLGLDWLRAFDLSFSQATLLTWLVLFTALLGVLGAYARIAFSINALALFVLLALPHRLGAIIHSHHLLWAAALLAASPCADVWSVDAYFAPRPLGPRARYLAALTVFRVLVACIYFFPGLHKLLSFASGTDPSAWMRSHLVWKWLQQGHAPALFAQLSPAWFAPLALSALLFELSMPFWIWSRRTRLLALFLAAAFHVGTALLMFIRFDSLAAVLVSLCDLESPLARPRARFDRADLPAISLREMIHAAQRSTLWLGGLLMAGVVVTGLSGQTQLYPFACYPTFAQQAAATMPSARVLLTREGTPCALPRPSDSPEWIAAFRIAGAYGDRLNAERAQAYLRRVAREKLRFTACRVDGPTQVSLVVEQLDWDFAAQRARLVKAEVVYSATASALGIAPAGGTNSSSSPLR